MGQLVSYLKVRPVGSNGKATLLGTAVRVFISGTQTAVGPGIVVVDGGGGFCSQNAYDAYFGLGSKRILGGPIAATALRLMTITQVFRVPSFLTLRCAYLAGSGSPRQAFPFLEVFRRTECWLCLSLQIPQINMRREHEIHLHVSCSFVRYGFF